MSISQAASAFAAIAVDPKATPEHRRKARTMLAAMGAVDTPAPRIVRVEIPAKETPAQVAARVLAENPELRREWNKARKEAEINARLSPREHELLARLDGPAAPTGAFSRGNTHYTPFVNRAEAKRMLAQLDDEMRGVEGTSRGAEEGGRGEVDALVRKGHGDPIGPSDANYEVQREELDRRFGK